MAIKSSAVMCDMVAKAKAGSFVAVMCDMVAKVKAGRLSAVSAVKKCPFVLLISICLLIPHVVSAQKVSLSTNILDYAQLGTLNADVSVSVDRRWSLTLGAKYNPFTYKTDEERQFQYRQQSYSLGARFWPWHVWSGWWVGSRLRYQEYNFGGVWSQDTEEGDRLGIGFSAGYTYMLSNHWNVEFGLGFWNGVTKYKVYNCPACGVVKESGNKYFILPDDVMIAFVYVF